MRHFLIAVLACLALNSAHANTPPLNSTRVHDGAGNALTSHSGALDVYPAGPINVTSTIASPLYAALVYGGSAIDPRTRSWALSSGTDSVAAVISSLPLPTGAATESTLSGMNSKFTTTVNGIKVDGSASTQPVTGTVSVSNFPASQAVSGTVTANQGGSWDLSVNNFPATQAISAASLPLPTGAATAANQTTANTSLSSIDSKITAVNTGAVVVSSSALPTGAATAANQTTANSSLSSIDTKTPALSGGRVPVDASGSIAPKTYPNANASFVLNTALTTTAATESAPANAIGFMLEASSANASNIRWVIGGGTASTSSGMRLESGRDTGFVPFAGSISLAAESGTLEYQLTWIKQ